MDRGIRKGRSRGMGRCGLNRGLIMIVVLLKRNERFESTFLSLSNLIVLAHDVIMQVEFDFCNRIYVTSWSRELFSSLTLEDDNMKHCWE